MMRPLAFDRVRAWLVLMVLVLASACGSRVRPVVTPTPDQFPEFAFPAIPASLTATSGGLVAAHTDAWRALQTGDARAAERGFGALVKRRPDFFPAETGLAYVDLARGQDSLALERFDRVMSMAPGYVPALLGRAQTLERLGRIDDAIGAFESVLAIQPDLGDLRRRVDSLRFRSFENALVEARRAEQSGELARAGEIYTKAIAASPESAFLYRELGKIEYQLHQIDAALEHAKKAVSLDPADASSFLLLADIYEGTRQWEQAIAALEQVGRLDPGADFSDRLQDMRDRVALAQLPIEFRAIPQVERVTRGELAALIGTRLETLLRTANAGPSTLVTDVRGHWARPWIMTVTQAGIMEVFENHTFQPQNPIRRGDLARAVSALLSVIAQRDTALGARWSGARARFSDLTPGNLYYPAASLAVTAGILETGGDSAFQAGRPVSGAEAIDAMERVERLASRVVASPRG